jgi:hypothetical protein
LHWRGRDKRSLFAFHFHNWGVTFQWFDGLRGTREHYVGTEKELADRPRNDERARTSKAKRLGWRDVLRKRSAA